MRCRIALWRRRRERPGRAAARAALRRAEHARREVEQQGPAVAEAAEVLRQARRRNHFAEAIARALEGGA